MKFQLCYASEATASDKHILNDLRNILNEARHFNIKHNVHGALFFADRYFFQCIEGEQSIVENLVVKLYRDSRPMDIRILSRNPIEQMHFSQWSMKYVSRNSQVQQFFRQKGFDYFEPLKLNEQDLPEFLTLLYDAKAVEV